VLFWIFVRCFHRWGYGNVVHFFGIWGFEKATFPTARLRSQSFRGLGVGGWSIRLSKSGGVRRERYVYYCIRSIRRFPDVFSRHALALPQALIPNPGLTPITGAGHPITLQVFK